MIKSREPVFISFYLKTRAGIDGKPGEYGYDHTNSRWDGKIEDMVPGFIFFYKNDRQRANLENKFEENMQVRLNAAVVWFALT